jgi:hypothetical protein
LTLSVSHTLRTLFDQKPKRQIRLTSGPCGRGVRHSLAGACLGAGRICEAITVFEQLLVD